MEQGLWGKLKWAAICGLARRLPDCKVMTMKLGESLDRPVSFRERVVAGLHLITCEACRLYLIQIKFIREAFRLREFQLAECADIHLSHEARERIKTTLQSQQ